MAQLGIQFAVPPRMLIEVSVWRKAQLMYQMKT